jgi:transposase-like protein
LSEELWEKYERFCERDLSGYDVVYLFVDGVFESLRQRAGMKEAILCSWGITSSGGRVLLHLGLGNTESFESWRDFFRHLQGRGLVHKLGNIRNKLPQEVIDEVMPQIKSAYYQTDPEIARLCASKILEAYSGKYPSAMKCFQEDFDACIQHTVFPAGHQRHITTTNLLERVCGEQKRRTKVIPRFFDEKSCLKLVSATLIRVSRKWRRVKMSAYGLTLLPNLRKVYGWEEDEGEYLSKQTAA